MDPQKNSATLRFGCSSMQSFSPEMCDRERQTVRQRQTDSETDKQGDRHRRTESDRHGENREMDTETNNWFLTLGQP